MRHANRRRLVMGMLGAAVLPARAQAQRFPVKPITLVVPYAAGGATDVTARRLAEALSRTIGGSVLVENRPGAATTLAASYVALASKDGYTILMAPGTTTSVNPYLYRNLNYKPEDFAPISLVSRQAFAVSVAADFAPRTVQDLVALAKSRPGGLTYGTTGTGSFTNILGEWMGKTLGIKVVEVPYKGTAPASIDLIGGRLDLNIEGISTAIPLAASGKQRVLTVTADERIPQLSGVPTLKESGYGELVAYTNFGLLAPAGTPETVVNTLHAAVVAAVTAPEFTARLAAGGESAITSTSPAQFAAFLRKEYEHWGHIVKPLNIKVD